MGVRGGVLVINHTGVGARGPTYRPPTDKDKASDCTVPFEDRTVQVILTANGKVDVQAARDNVSPSHQARLERRR
jgi:predicted small lipoprotein YifL